MPQTVTLTDGRTATFPDGMSKDDMAAALKKFPPLQEPNFKSQNETDAQGNALVRGAEQFYEKSPLKAGVELAKGAANVVAHPLDTYFGLVPIADTVKGLAKAQWDQAVQAAQKAKEAAKGGGMLS